LPQPARLVAALGYVTILLIVASYLSGEFPPEFGITSLWFYSAAAALLIGDLLLEPFFTRPVEALANGFSLVLVLAAATTSGVSITEAQVTGGRVALIAYGVVVVVAALIAIASKDRPGRLGELAGSCTSLVAQVGSARAVYSVLYFASVYAAYANSALLVATLYLFWIVVFYSRPAERLAAWLMRRNSGDERRGGFVERVEDPRTVVARFAGSAPTVGTTVELGEPRRSGTVVEVTSLVGEPRARIEMAASTGVFSGGPVRVLEGPERVSALVGYVTDGTNLDELRMIAIRSAPDVGLAEGGLVEASIGARKALYQVVAAELGSNSEREYQRKVVSVTARKLGAWNAGKLAFEPVPWIPEPGMSVTLVSTDAAVGFDPRFVGHIPNTNYGVSLDLDQAITHNTAILGILGIGKTTLAWELIRRLVSSGIKVVVLDISGRYGPEFNDIVEPGAEENIATTIETRIAGNLDNPALRNNEAGNVMDFRDAVGAVLQRFVEGDARLLVLNPNRFQVSRMEGRPFQNQANFMVRLTMVEVTRLIAEKLLALAQAAAPHEPIQKANVCLVLEEAHSLVPEWNSTADDAERQAVNGTARALLQGRKYGLGCLLITQRTANVTKSILNQCNTVFGMRVYDATGMGFLENYIGPAHARLLAALADRQAVVFGRASSCSAPIIISLNDYQEFKTGYWAERVGTIPTTPAFDHLGEHHEPVLPPDERPQVPAHGTHE
jgi:hypothetical protein